MAEAFPTSVKLEINRSEPVVVDANELVLAANGDRTAIIREVTSEALYAITHTPDEGDSGTIAEAGNSISTTFTTTSPFTFTFTPSSTPKGILLWIANNTDSTNRVTKVTYGGVLMAFGGGGSRSGTGFMGLYYLLSGVPSGLQTVSITHDGNAAVKIALIVGVTGERDLQISESLNKAGLLADPATGLFSTRLAVRYGCVLSEHNTVAGIPVLSTSTSLESNDFGTEVVHLCRRTAIDLGTTEVGFSFATSIEQAIFISVALEEVPFVSKLEEYDVPISSAPTLTRIVTVVDDLVSNTSEHSMVFNSTSSHLYVLGSAGTLYTLDIGVSPPTLVDTQAGFGGRPSDGGHYGHTIHRVGSNLYVASAYPATLQNGQIHKFDISTPAAPSSTQILSTTTLQSGTATPLSVGYVTPDEKWILYPVFASESVGGVIARIDIDGTMTEGAAVVASAVSTGGPKIQPRALAFLPNVLRTPPPSAAVGESRGVAVAIGIGTTTISPSVGRSAGTATVVGQSLQNKFLILQARYTDTNSLGGGVSASVHHYFWMTYRTDVDTSWDTIVPHSHDDDGGIADASRANLSLLGLGDAAGRFRISTTPENARLVRAERDESYVYVFISDDDITLPGRLAVYEFTDLNLAIDGRVGRTVPRLLTSIEIGSLRDLGALIKVSTALVGIGGNESLDDRSLIEFTEPTGWVELPAAVNSPGISIDYGLAGSGPMDRIADTGVMTFELDNSQFAPGGALGRFSPDNTDLFTGLRVGREIRLAVVLDAVTYYPWWGAINTITPSPGKNLDRRSSVTCVDFMDYLSRSRTRLLAMRFDDSAAQGVHLILNRVDNDPVGIYHLNEPGDSDIYPVLFDKARDESTSIITELQRVCQSERSLVYVVGGVLYVEGRNVRSDAVEGAADLVLTDSNLQALETDHTAENVINDIEAKVHPRRRDTVAVTLFTYQNTPEIAPLGELKFVAPYSDPEQIAQRVGGFDLVQPVLTTDYTFNTAEDGSGDDIVGYIFVNVKFGSNSAEVRVLNVGASSGFLTLFKIRGKGVYTYEAVTARGQNRQIESQFGPLQSLYDMPYHDQPGVAEDAVGYILHKYGTPATFVRAITIWANQSSTLLDFVVKSRVISTLIDLTETVTGLTGVDYFVQNARVIYREKQLIYATLGLAPADTDVIFKFGEGPSTGSEFDGTDVLGSAFIEA
jgi:hypothetical protein